MREDKYKNLRYKPNDRYAIEFYQADPNKEIYRGFEIHHQEVQYGEAWHIVQNGICLSMMAGPNGARQKIDEYLDNPNCMYPLYTRKGEVNVNFETWYKEETLLERHKRIKGKKSEN